MLSNSDFNRAYQIDEDQKEEEKNVYDDRFYSNESKKRYNQDIINQQHNLGFEKDANNIFENMSARVYQGEGQITMVKYDIHGRSFKKKIKK